MPSRPNPESKIWWIRAPVAVELRAKFEYVKLRFGMFDLPESVRYTITFLLYDIDPEELCQVMAASIGVSLPELPAPETGESDTATDGQEQSNPNP